MPPFDAPNKRTKLRVLNLEDDPNDSELIQAELETEWPEIELLRVDTRAAFIQALTEFKPDVVLSDYHLGGFNGGEALAIVRRSHPEIPVVMVTGALGDIEAVELLKLGARDYVMKDHLKRLTSSVQHALSMEQGIRLRKAAEQSLRKSEEEIRDLVERSPIAMIVDSGLGEDEKVLMMNRRFTALFGYTMDDIPDVHHWWQLAYPDPSYREKLQKEWTHAARRAIQDHSEIEPQETTVTCKDGILRHVRVSFASIGSRNIVTFEDLTERKQAELKIQRLNQLYAALSQCNQTIVRSENEDGLFKQICQIAVEFGGFKMAWIGLPDRDSHMVKPVASFGEGAENYLRDIQISTDVDNQYGRGPTGTAIRENHPVWNQDFMNNPLSSPWQKQAKILGWRSSAALPLHREGQVIGAFTLYADVPHAFDAESCELLLEMADDISYALDNLKHELERKQMDDRLLKLLQAVEQSPNSIVITDLDANIEYANPEFARATGYSPQEFLGKNPRILHSGKTPRASYDALWNSLTHGEVWKGEFINRRKDGSEYTEAVQISPVRQADGHISNYLAIKEDITVGKQMQQEILRDSLRIEALLKINKMAGQLPETEFLRFGLDMAEKITSSKISFIHFVSDDGQTIKLGTWSATTTQSFGDTGPDMHYPLSQAGAWADCLRKNHALIFNDYTEPEDKRGLPGGLAGLRRLMTVPVIENDKARMVLGVGNKEEEYNEDDMEAVQLIGNDVWRIVQHIRTESDLKNALEEQCELNIRLATTRTQLLQSEKMASIGILAAGVAHEINNPIGYVNSNLGTLEKYLADIFTVMNKTDELCELQNTAVPEVDELHALKQKLNIEFLREDIKSLLRESREGLERVKKIVLDLKSFSRSSSDENWQWADLHDALESTLTVVWNELKYKCEVVKEYGDLPKIYCLPSQLGQVFMNLLVNAAQSIEKRGTITIRTGHEDGQVWITISDTGSGMPPHVLARLFEPFFTTKPVGSGTGLGLSVSYGIIDHHHGKLEVQQTEVGQGTTFRVTLPINQPGMEEQ